MRYSRCVLAIGCLAASGNLTAAEYKGATIKELVKGGTVVVRVENEGFRCRRENCSTTVNSDGGLTAMKKAFVVTAAAFLAVLLVGGFLLFSRGPSPHDVVLKHVPDEWQLVTITRPAAIDESPAAKEAGLHELFDDPADRAFPDEAENVEEVFDVLFPANVHVHFWTFKQPPAKEHIIGKSPAAGAVRGLPTWAHRLGRLAIPQPRVVVASKDADWLETVLLEGLVRMRAVVSPPEGDLAVQVNLERDNPAYAEMCAQLAALGGGGPGKPAGIRRLGLGFRFRDPASVSVEFTAESRNRATEFQRHLAEGAAPRKEKVEALVEAGLLERGTPEHKALLATVEAPARAVAV